MLRRSIIQAFLNAEFSHASIPKNHILTIWAAVALCFFNLGTCRTVYQEDFASPVGQPCLWRRCFSLQGCMQWEEDMVWARQGTQIDGAARLMKIRSRRCREAGGAVQGCVIVLGECNAPPRHSLSHAPSFLAVSVCRPAHQNSFVTLAFPCILFSRSVSPSLSAPLLKCCCV